MATAKVTEIPKREWKGKGKVPSNILHTRLSYLYQAAHYLASQQQPAGKSNVHNTASADEGKQLETTTQRPLQAASRRLLYDLRNVALKQTIRISPQMKHSICKSCGSLLIVGSTCSSEIENKSKKGKKPWADVLVRKCNACGAAKRFPMRERQKKRSLRPREPNADTQMDQAG